MSFETVIDLMEAAVKTGSEGYRVYVYNNGRWVIVITFKTGAEADFYVRGLGTSPGKDDPPHCVVDAATSTVLWTSHSEIKSPVPTP